MNYKMIWCFSFLLLFGISCQDYPEGPLLSLNSPESRINGNYSILAVTEDGIDQLYIVEQLQIKSINFGSQITPSNAYSLSISYNDTSLIDIANWSLSNDHADINVTNACSVNGALLNPAFAPVPGLLADSLCQPSGNIWEIIELKDHKMWLKGNVNGKDYEIHLCEN